MARKNTLDALLQESTLFKEGEVREENLTPEQRMALQRLGRSERVQSSGGGRAISAGGKKALESAAMSEAGAQLASGDSLIVPNVQRDKSFREDERTRGGERTIADKLSAVGTRSSSPSVVTPQGLASTGGAASTAALTKLASTAKNIYKAAKGQTQSPMEPEMQLSTGENLIKAATDPTSKANLVGVGDPNEYFKTPGPGLKDSFVDTPSPDIGPLANPLADAGAANTAATGGQVGGADIAGLAAAESKQAAGMPLGQLAGGLGGLISTGMGLKKMYGDAAKLIGGDARQVSPLGNVLNTAGTTAAATLGSTAMTGASATMGGSAGAAAGMAGTALGAAANVIPYLGFALQGYNILSRGFGSRDKPHGMRGSEAHLLAAEGAKKDMYGRDYVRYTDPETGKVYLQDPVAKENYDADVWFELHDQKALDVARKKTYNKYANQNIRMDRGRREEYEQAGRTNYTGRDQAKDTQQRLGGLYKSRAMYDTSRKKHAELKSAGRDWNKGYREYDEYINSVEYTGKG